MKLSVVIPSYNESRNFNRGCLEQVRDYLKTNHLNWEVIIVDDGSTDGSDKKIKIFAGKNNWYFIENPHQGKAASVMTGVLAATNPYILFTDFDQATPLSEVEKLLPFLSKGYQIVVGSREIKGARRQQEPFYRHIMGKVFNFVVQLVAVKGIHDTQCGFKIFSTHVARELFQALKVYRPKPEKYAFTGAFDVELLYLAGKSGIKIAEVPIVWTHAATTRVSPFRDSIRMFWHVLKIRLYD
ncbi:MAG: glycosyltransferase family 2 protein [Candidatus Beckwithbacteria bacterium]|nr:glycosyltransferase family 2 protein [Candidatus Beckwithbacteria bacterium]